MRAAVRGDGPPRHEGTAAWRAIFDARELPSFPAPDALCFWGIDGPAHGPRRFLVYGVGGSKLCWTLSCAAGPDGQIESRAQLNAPPGPEQAAYADAASGAAGPGGGSGDGAGSLAAGGSSTGDSGRGSSTLRDRPSSAHRSAAAASSAGLSREARGEVWRERALRRMAGFPAELIELVRSTSPAALHLDGIYDRPPIAAPWGAGAVTLLGDAAHPQRPSTGQVRRALI